MIWAITVWMLLTTGLTMETREFGSRAECEAYRQSVAERRFSLSDPPAPVRPSGTGVLIGACKGKVVDSPPFRVQR